VKYLTLSAVLLLGASSLPVLSQEIGSDVWERHQATIGQVYALSATFEHNGEVFNGKKVEKAYRGFRWAFDESTMRERQSGWVSGPKFDSDGFALNRYDIFVDRNTGSGLLNWDWNESPPLVPNHQGTVRAHYGKRDSLLRGQALYPECWILFKVQANHIDPPRNVRDFLSDSGRNIISGPSVDGGLVKVVARHPQFHTENQHPAIGYKGCVEEYYFDLDHGSLLRKFLVKNPDGSNFETEVTAFEDFGDGIFLPTEITHTSRIGKNQLVSSLNRFTLSDIQINENVSDDEFEFRFPENCLVVNTDIPEDGPQDRYEMFLWGPNNKPIAQLASAVELANYDHLAKRTLVATKGNFYARSMLIVLSIGIILLLWKLRRT